MTIGRQYETSDQTGDEYQSSDQYRATDESRLLGDDQFQGEEHESGFPRHDEGRNEDPAQSSAFEPAGTSEGGTFDGTPDLGRDGSPADSRDDSFGESRDDALGETHDKEAHDTWETPSATSGSDDLATVVPADTRVVETPAVDDGSRAPEHALDDRSTALQGAFVDDPDTAVKDAAALVDDAIQHLMDNLQNDRSGDSSTEKKRLAFQRYRAVHEVLTRV